MTNFALSRVQSRRSGVITTEQTRTRAVNIANSVDGADRDGAAQGDRACQFTLLLEQKFVWLHGAAGTTGVGTR